MVPCRNYGRLQSAPSFMPRLGGSLLFPYTLSMLGRPDVKMALLLPSGNYRSQLSVKAPR